MDNLKGRRKHMTSAQKDKRSQIAEAIHREHPDMPMAMKMKIATAGAMKRKMNRGHR